MIDKQKLKEANERFEKARIEAVEETDKLLKTVTLSHENKQAMLKIRNEFANPVRLVSSDHEPTP